MKDKETNTNNNRKAKQFVAANSITSNLQLRLPRRIIIQHHSLDQVSHLCHISTKHLSIGNGSLWNIILFLASQTDQVKLKKHIHDFFLSLFQRLTSMQDSKTYLGSTGITHSIFHLVRQKDHNFQE